MELISVKCKLKYDMVVDDKELGVTGRTISAARRSRINPVTTFHVGTVIDAGLYHQKKVPRS